MNDLDRPAAIVFCERLDNESFCAAVVRELAAFYEVRPCGPGWPAETLAEVDLRGARFYLELDAASGNFVRPEGLERLALPKFAWLIDTHKKPGFHRELSAQMDLTFHAMATWGHVLEGERVWLPVHCDQELFRPREAERDLDAVFVGSQPWRADALRRIAERHGLRVHVACTTGPREKSETAALYARAKVVFNRHVTNDLNFRVVEAMASGRVLLTDAQPNGQYELFEEERHYLLYKDDRDLERQLLRVLADDGLRLRIEREAAGLTHACHTTRARTAQLKDAIEGFLARSGRAPAPPPDLAEADAEPGPPRRWLVLAGPRPPTVEQASDAELVARGLARAGHEVVLASSSAEPPLFPPGFSRPGEPHVVWLDPGPLPRRGKGELEMEPAAALITGLVRLAEEAGPFDGLLGQGALGALVLAPVAERLGLPFLLALPECEVVRRGNQLTREQLHQAELEEWGCERAAQVLVPAPEVAEGVRRHYRAERVAVVPVPRRPRPIAASGLFAELGLGAGFVLILSPPLSRTEVERLLDPPGFELAEGLVLLCGETWVRRSAGQLELLARGPASGPALAALVSGARAVVGLDRRDPRLEEARTLGAPVAVAAGRDLGAILAVARSAQPEKAEAAERREARLAAILSRALASSEVAGALR